MQSPALTLKIEMFGNLIDELNHWHLIDEDDGIELDYVEDRFMETLRAVRDMREVLLIELEEYVLDCKTNELPIDLGYYRIKKQLTESTFELIR